MPVIRCNRAGMRAFHVLVRPSRDRLSPRRAKHWKIEKILSHWLWMLKRLRTWRSLSQWKGSKISLPFPVDSMKTTCWGCTSILGIWWRQIHPAKVCYLFICRHVFYRFMQMCVDVSKCSSQSDIPTTLNFQTIKSMLSSRCHAFNYNGLAS